MSTRYMPVDVFVNENLSSAENRFNLCFFHLLSNSLVRKFVLDILDLDSTVIIYPVHHKYQRPDFGIAYFGDKRASAFIEVELGRIDLEQNNRYESIFGKKVYSIANDEKADIPLYKFKEKLEEFLESTNNIQMKTQFFYAIKLIEECTSDKQHGRGRVIWDNHKDIEIFIDCLEKYVGIEEKKGDSSKIYVDTTTSSGKSNKGLSLGIQNIDGNYIKIANRTGGREFLQFRTIEYYQSNKTFLEPCLSEWINLVKEMTRESKNQIQYEQKHNNMYNKVNLDVLNRYAEQISHVIKKGLNKNNDKHL